MAKRSGVWLLTTTVLMTLSVSATVDRAQNVIGRWAGYFDSASNPGFKGALSIQISSQDGRRFAGEICLPPGPCTPVMGTISDSGVITMTGRSAQVRSIEMHGKPFDRNTGVDSSIVGDYHIVRSGGSIDRGNVAVVHQASDNDVPAHFAGMWGGQATPQGSAAALPVEVTFEIDRRGAITGSLAWATIDPRSSIVGQTIRANGADQIAMVGLLDDAIVVANLAPSGSVTDLRGIDGSYGLIASVDRGLLEQGHISLFHNIPASRQSEARANLKALYTAAKAYFQEKDVYSTKVQTIGFSPERGNRYRYVLTVYPMSLEDRSGVTPISSFTDEGIDVDLFKFPQNLYPTITQGPCAGTPVWGITGVNPAHFTAVAYGNIDGDNTLDVWTISTVSRTLTGSNCDAVGNVASGEPANDQNDVNR